MEKGRLREILVFIASKVSPYFQREYSDGDNDPLIISSENSSDTLYIVNRPIYGLCHSLRMALLIKKLIKYLIGDIHPHHKETRESCKLCGEIEERIPWIMLVTAFQSSGRQSDVSKSENPELFYKYRKADIENFLIEYPDGIWSSKLLEENNDSDIAKMIRAAYIIDLRRIPHFSKENIKKCFFKKMYEIENEPNETIKIFNILWKYEGRLLRATGDRDLICRQNYLPRFGELSLDEMKLARVLSEVD